MISYSICVSMLFLAWIMADDESSMVLRIFASVFVVAPLDSSHCLKWFSTSIRMIPPGKRVVRIVVFQLSYG